MRSALSRGWRSVNRLQRVLLVAVIGVTCCRTGWGRELLSENEAAQRELERKKQEPPVLAVSPTVVARAVKQGEPVSFRFEIKNAGGQTLAWKLASAPEWVQASPTSGSLGHEESQTVRAAIDTTAPPRGNRLSSRIVIEARDAKGSPSGVKLDIEVTVPPTSASSADEEKPTVSAGTEPSVAASVIPDDDMRDLAGQSADGGGKRGALAVRAGYLMPEAGEVREVGNTVLVGVAYRGKRGIDSRITYEVGVDAANMESHDALYEWTTLTGEVDLLLSLGAGEAATSVYVLAGIGGLVELVTKTTDDSEYTNYAGAVGLGAGVSLTRDFDVRYRYMMLLGAENVTGISAVALTMAF